MAESLTRAKYLSELFFYIVSCILSPKERSISWSFPAQIKQNSGTFLVGLSLVVFQVGIIFIK